MDGDESGGIGREAGIGDPGGCPGMDRPDEGVEAQAFSVRGDDLRGVGFDHPLAGVNVDALLLKASRGKSLNGATVSGEG